MENWYRFSAYNKMTLYGWGTETEADKYGDWLNSGEEINHYSATKLSDDEAYSLGIESKDMGFSLCDELMEIEHES